MQKNVKFNQASRTTISQERISGVLLSIAPFQADGTTVCNIADLNRIAIDLVLHRHGQEPVYICETYLDTLLTAFFSQTARYQQSTKKLSDGYKVLLDLGTTIDLQGDDKFEVRLNPQNTSFTSLSVNNSFISVESIPAYGASGGLPVLKTHAIGNSEKNISENLGDDVVKVVLATDYTANYDVSTKAKPENVEITADGGFSKSVSEDLLFAENMHYLDFNPETPVKDLVVYAGAKLDGVKIKGKLTKGADADAEILVVHERYDV